MAEMKMKIEFDDEQMAEIMDAIASLRKTICSGCPFLEEDEDAN